ncbi:TetR family transcriptional regulator [Azorhizobium oxalatiphilum]|uniref:TetR family transcriptional regulator n=1 Tax=Azorhizobium oxalatiphilum TaxID=980631 RepID=A0A917CIF5_9HYPH|nr:TetR/AcrR family transcriptional regulator [Azorhizobium oxalatiphilum]GGF89404.1 TetR family transcriptional regulator [Azorhizobium oxalatiphilum]
MNQKKTARTREDVLPELGEVFREHGFEGASLADITARTGLGKGSLYHFFPGGKEEMAEAVLDHIDHWFETEVYQPLREDEDPRAAITRMLDGTDAYFRSGRRVCLVGVLALNLTRDRFAARLSGYFTRWRDALASALCRLGHRPELAGDLAEEAVVAIQGGLVIARALDDPSAFTRTLERLRVRLLDAG